MKRLSMLLVALVVLAAIPSVLLAAATHVVRKGDTLGKIARSHHVSVAKIQEANGLEGTRLSVGTKLVLPGGKAHSKPRKARSAKGRPGTVHAPTPAEEPPAGAQTSLAGPQGSRRFADAWKPPTEAELAELARGPEAADAAPPAVAAAPGAPGSPVAEESIKIRLLRVAQRMLEVPYRYGGTTLWGLDCSGFVQKTFAFLNLDLPRTAREQYREGMKIAKADLSPGGIYLGDNRFVHASARDRKVTIDSLDEPYYTKHYLGAKRLLAEGEYTPN
ncbi:MAG: endopeptidase LytE [Deltaproteobacteria bacterium]|nr:endopeptidase LytE [Deltaproteobacteria bacterium]